MLGVLVSSVLGVLVGSVLGVLVNSVLDSVLLVDMTVDEVSGVVDSVELEEIQVEVEFVECVPGELSSVVSMLVELELVELDLVE